MPLVKLDQFLLDVNLNNIHMKLLLKLMFSPSELDWEAGGWVCGQRALHCNGPEQGSEAA